MDISQYTHTKLSRFLLKLFGVWPHQSTFIKNRNYSIFAIWTSLIVFPMAQSLIDKPDMDIQIYFDTVVSMTWILGSFALATMFYLRPCKLMKLDECITSDWTIIINDPKEFAIMQSHFRQGQSLTFIYTGSVITAAILYMTLHYYLPVIIGNAEESAKVISNYSGHWIIRDDFRELQILIHLSLEMFYGTMVYIVIMAVYLCGVEHTCGMNDIVSYRLRRLMDKNRDGTDSSKDSKSDNEIISDLLGIIQKHRSALKCAHIVSRLFSRAFYISHIGILLCLAICHVVFGFSINVNDPRLTLKILCAACIFMEHLFYLNYGGELIIGYSNKVFESTYYMNWYLMSPKVRRLLLIIILRSSNVKRLTAGTMTFSLENVSKIIKISWSLATVLSSTQKIT